MKPADLRKQFLELAAPLMEQYIEAAIGDKPLQGVSSVAAGEVWDTLKHIILTADDPTPLGRSRGKSPEKKVEQVLAQVASGKLTPSEGKAHMQLIQMGVDTTELPRMLELLEKAGQ